MPSPDGLENNDRNQDAINTINVHDSTANMSSISAEHTGPTADRAPNGTVPGSAEVAARAAGSQPSSPATSEQKQKKRKTGGFLSFLGCCGASEADQSLEENKENAHVLDKLPQRPTTAKSRNRTNSDQQGSRTGSEKQSSPTAAQDQPVAGSSQDANAATGQLQDGKQSSVSGGASDVSDPDNADASEHHAAANTDTAEDTAMPDAPQSTSAVETDEEAEGRTLPPPPPGPGPVVAAEQPATDVAIQEPQKWLLPPITPEHKGKKCLVLDLDETLVHSSFKVGSPVWYHMTNGTKL